ncbi:MAG: crossover junction endodeoxyribonuclease RuvC [Candidatus Pacebacteria bacterium]|nr:crossover junction endodeoxyribonuclease RuvC [Candidatus Paceibacterota bacterium]
MIIIGIDPGTEKTGFGIIKIKDKKAEAINWGCILTESKNSDSQRLVKINREISKLILKYKPNYVAIERLFFFKNLKTALPVSQAKGVILLAIAKKKIPIYEFTPLQVKMTITGYGRAEKKQVQKMIENLLKIKIKQDDAADALGIALCCFLKQVAKKSCLT